MALPVFPSAPLTLPGFSVHRRPTFVTITRTGRQGREGGAAQQTLPQWEFELTYEVLRDETQNIDKDLSYGVGGYTELQEIMKLYLGCFGQYGEFYFSDPSDCSRSMQYLCKADGGKVEFPFMRTITDITSGRSFTEPVGGVDLTRPITVYVNSVPADPTTWTVSEDLTKLVFFVPPPYDSIIEARYYFYYRCRFISDSVDLEEFAMNRWAASSIRFRSVIMDYHWNPLDPCGEVSGSDLGNLVGAACVSDLRWTVPLDRNLFSPASFPYLAPQVDRYNNLYVMTRAALHIYNPNGALIARMTQKGLADAIDAWFGSNIIIREGSGDIPDDETGFFATPILEGEYILAYLGATPFSSSEFAHWWTILGPVETGTPRVLGAVYFSALLGPPYVGYPEVMGPIAPGDPILFKGSFNFGATQYGIGVLPSAYEITSEEYRQGYPTSLGGATTMGACRVPRIVIYPIGDTGLSTHLIPVGATGGSNKNSNTGFLLPDSEEGGISLYFYMSRSYLDYVSTGSSTNTSPEVKNVIQPAHPYGAVAQFKMGEIGTYRQLGDYALANDTDLIDLAAYNARENYYIVSEAWHVPYRDEYSFISTGAGGSDDAYTMRPSLVTRRNNGRYWIVFYMPGISDAEANTNGTLYDTVRLLEFDPSTETTVQLFRLSCPVYPGTGQVIANVRDYFQVMWLEQVGSTVSLNIYGHTSIAEDDGRLYRAVFCQFEDPNV